MIQNTTQTVVHIKRQNTMFLFAVEKTYNRQIVMIRAHSYCIFLDVFNDVLFLLDEKEFLGEMRKI